MKCIIKLVTILTSFCEPTVYISRFEVETK